MSSEPRLISPWVLLPGLRGPDKPPRSLYPPTCQVILPSSACTGATSVSGVTIYPGVR